MTESTQSTYTVSSSIIEVLLHHNCIPHEEIDVMTEKYRSEQALLLALKQRTPDRYEDALQLLIKHEIFTQEDHDSIFLKTADEMEAPSIQETDDAVVEHQSETSIIVEDISEKKEVEDSPDNDSIENQTEQETNQAVQESNNREGRTKPFTRDEVDALIKQWVNLFEAVPGHLLPKDNNVFYAKYQLYRFIDSWASDFFLQTRKADGKIWYEILFRIAWENEVQDQTTPAYPGDESKENMNLFFARVRKWIGSTGRLNADIRHIVQDGGFTLEYRKKTRDFRLSAMPVRCYDQAYPRYAIRLTSEGDNIDFDKIKMLPFVKKHYTKMILNKIAGTIIVTGPTGSGKTTTIYGMLNEVDSNKYGVLSIEKPIESRLRGIHQTEEDSVPRDDPRESYNLKLAIKGVLRQALDLIFVGEMRDREELEETIRAGLIGNKLITTFHTNSCIHTILRLQNEWLTRNAIGNGVKYITAQRLAPSICPHCSLPDPEASKKLEKMMKPFMRSQRNLQASITKCFADASINNIDDIEFILERELRFLSEEDIDGIMSEIESDKEGFELCRGDSKKVVSYLLRKTEMYPNRPAREAFQELIKNPNIRVASSTGCRHENCRMGYSKMRTGIYEVLELDKSIRRFIQDPDSRLIDMEDFLADKGFITLRTCWFYHVLSGEIAYDDLIDMTE